METIFKFFFLIALLNGLGLIVALLSRKENRLANFFLTGMLAAGIYGQFVIYLVISGQIMKFPYLLYSEFPANLEVPALLYLYIVALMIPDFRWERRRALHFLPLLFGLLVYGGLHLFGQNSWVENDVTFYQVERYFLVAVLVLVFGAYLVAGFWEMKRFQNLLLQYFSEIRHVRLLWIRWLLLLLTIPWVLSLMEVATGPYVTVEKWVIPTAAMIILLIGFYGFRQSVIFSAEEKSEIQKSHDHTPQLFALEELAQWKNRLEKFTYEAKPYLNPELHLIDLAKGLHLKPYQVSEILNRGEGTTFYEYINRLRVEEAKRRLLDPQLSYMNILGIAMDCGFNSKSVFNETFRKFTGKTPSSFRHTRSAA